VCVCAFVVHNTDDDG